jgi:hypothetical protein
VKIKSKHKQHNNLPTFYKNYNNCATTKKNTMAQTMNYNNLLNKKLYNRIFGNPNSRTQNMHKEFSTFPIQLIEQMTNYQKPTNGFKHPITQTINPPLQPYQPNLSYQRT